MTDLVEIVQDRVACCQCGDDLGPAPAPSTSMRELLERAVDAGDRVLRHPCVVLSLGRKVEPVNGETRDEGPFSTRTPGGST